MVWRRVPNLKSAYIPQSPRSVSKLPVHQEGNLIGRHLERSFATLNEFVTTGEGEACPYALELSRSSSYGIFSDTGLQLLPPAQGHDGENSFGVELEETIEDLDTRHAFTVRYLDPTTSPMHEAQPYPMPYRRNIIVCKL